MDALYNSQYTCSQLCLVLQLNPTEVNGAQYYTQRVLTDSLVAACGLNHGRQRPHKFAGENTGSLANSCHCWRLCGVAACG